jgi:ribonuclease-3
MVSQKIQADRNTPVFVSRVLIAGIYCGMGEGYSKKESHQAAARQAYRHIKRDNKFADGLKVKS